MRATPLLLLIGSALCLGGRALAKDLEVRISPQLSITSSNVGQGRPVVLSVVDKRPTQDIPRLLQLPFQRGPIKVIGELAPIYDKVLRDGFTQLGFSVVTAGAPDTPNVTVEIMSLKYGEDASYVASFNVISKVRVATTFNGALVYEKSIETASHKDCVLCGPHPFKDEDRIVGIEQAVSKNLTKVLQDPQLISALSSPGPPVQQTNRKSPRVE